MGSLVPRLKFLESSFSGATPQFPLRFFFFFLENEHSPAGKTRFCFRGAQAALASRVYPSRTCQQDARQEFIHTTAVPRTALV